MFELKLFASSIEDIFDKVSKIQKTIFKCSLSPNFVDCWNKELGNVGATFSAMREMGVGEFDPSLEDILIDGIVVDEDKAKNTPCKCVVFNGKELCWSPGIIGMLRQDQIAKYCPTKKYEEAPKLKAHLEEFKKVAKETKGIPLAERIQIMKKELEKKASEEDFEEMPDMDESLISLKDMVREL